MDSQPPPPTYSNTPFIVAIVAMLAGIGGLIFWKTTRGEPAAEQEVTPAPSAIAAVAAEPPLLLDAPAPPPPPADEPAAETAAAGKPSAKPNATASTANPCEGECGGTVTPALNGQLAGVGRTARRCYYDALANNGDLKGRIMVSVRVGASGQVCSAKIASNDTGSPELGACVAQKYRAAQLSAPQKGCVDVEVPLNFVPDNAR